MKPKQEEAFLNLALLVLDVEYEGSQVLLKHRDHVLGDEAVVEGLVDVGQERIGESIALLSELGVALTDLNVD